MTKNGSSVTKKWEIGGSNEKKGSDDLLFGWVFLQNGL
jgi:hypothetical protein